jgi:hypothetical protein
VIMNCVYCGCDMRPERAELYDYCTSEECYKQGFKQSEYVVLGVHKSTPVICSVRDTLVTDNRSYMVTK